MSLKTFIEIVPLFIFLIFYKTSGIIEATIGVIAATIIGNIITYIQTKTINKFSLFITLLLVVMGSLTIYSGDARFIKMKLTILNLIFSLILFAGIIFKKGLLKSVLGSKIEMAEKNWIILSRRFGMFFLSLGILNEIIWRNFPENYWVNFKVFGVLALTFIFLAIQTPFLNKHGQIKE